MQQKPWSREERFLSTEKQLLSPLPQQAFEIKHYRELKVARNNHVYLAQDKHYYRVPYTYIGTKVKVIYTRSLVRVYSKGEQIAVHVRSYQPSGYSTSKEHLCSHHQHYLERSPEYYLEKARKKSAVLCQFIKLLFEQERYPEQVYRTCDGLLSLQSKAAPEDFDRACRLAIECQGYSYRFVRNVLENKMASHVEEPKQDTPLPVHQNIRGRDYYAQTNITF